MNIADPFRPHLASFIADTQDLPALQTRTRWIRTGLAKVYVRKCFHAVGSRVLSTLDIADVEVYQKRQGTWTQMLKTAQELCPWQAVYVENVHSNILHAHLERLRLTDPRWVQVRQSYAWIKGIYML